MKVQANIEMYQIVNSLLDSYDLRNSSELELRKDRSAYAQNITIFLKGQPIQSTVIYKGQSLGDDLIESFLQLFNDSMEDLKAVSRNQRARRARDTNDSTRERLNETRYFTIEEDGKLDLNDFHTPEPTASTEDRVLSEILPNFGISLKAVMLPWMKGYSEATGDIEEPEVIEYSDLKLVM